jgi:hypothetical protein
MALLTDGNPNDAEALRMYETAILDVAKVEAIDLDAKLELATGEISEAVLNVLLDHSADHARRTAGVSDVVVTSPLKRWHALHALEIVYRDAFHSQLNDRYRAKWNEYQELSRNAWEDVLRNGIGLVTNPIPKGPAPVFSFVAGMTPATAYWARLSWVSATGQEGAPGDLAAYQTPEGSVLAVGAANPPAAAVGFNVYLGLSATTLSLQTTSAVPGGESFVLPQPVLIDGDAPGIGQAPDTYVIGGRMLRRG